MKKYLHLFLLLFVHLLQAQEQSGKKNTLILRNKNEIRLDIGQLLINARLQVAYERFLNKDFSTGVCVMYYGDNYQDSSIFYDSNLEKKIKIEPFVRYSISKNLERFFILKAIHQLLVVTIKKLNVCQMVNMRIMT